LQLNVTHQLLAHADDVNSLAENINITKKNNEASVEVNAKKKKN
jgi:hypothetical protein